MRTQTFKIIVILTIIMIFVFKVSPSIAIQPVESFEISYYSGLNYSGLVGTIRLDPSGMSQLSLPSLGPLNEHIQSIKLGANLVAYVYDQSELMGSHLVLTESKADLADWNNKISSLLIYLKTEAEPRGVEIIDNKNGLRRFLPIGDDNKKRVYNLEGTEFDRKVGTAVLKGKDVTVYLLSRFSATQLQQEVKIPPPEIKRPNDTYNMRDYKALGKIMEIEVIPDADARKNFLKPTEVQFCEHPDLQGRCFRSWERKPYWRHVMFNTAGASDKEISSVLLGSEAAIQVFPEKWFYGQNQIIRTSQNLSDWNDRILSAIVFPPDQPKPQGIQLIKVPDPSFGSPGSSDLVFLPMPVSMNITRSRRAMLRSALNDTIIRTTRSGDDMAYEVCEHPDFEGSCLTSPSPGNEALETNLKGDLFRGASSLEWWETGPNARNRRVCIDHGNNISSCTYAQLSGPGYKSGEVSQSDPDIQEYEFQEKPIKKVSTVPNKLSAIPDICGANQSWHWPTGRCLVNPNRLKQKINKSITPPVLHKLH